MKKFTGFSRVRVVSAHVFRITRNADVARNEEEADDLLEMIEEELRGAEIRGRCQAGGRELNDRTLSVKCSWNGWG